jgi:hypothetical protein
VLALEDEDNDKGDSGGVSVKVESENLQRLTP